MSAASTRFKIRASGRTLNRRGHRQCGSSSGRLPAENMCACRVFVLGDSSHYGGSDDETDFALEMIRSSFHRRPNYASPEIEIHTEAPANQGSSDFPDRLRNFTRNVAGSNPFNTSPWAKGTVGSLAETTRSLCACRHLFRDAMMAPKVAARGGECLCSTLPGERMKKRQSHPRRGRS